jgi:hypothetical protein
MNVYLVLTYMYPDVDPMSSWGVGDDGSGPRIMAWYMDTPQPTDEELAAAEPKAIAWQALNDAKAQAQAALDASDITVLRLIELNSTLVPTDWKNYRNALRSVMNATEADGPQTLPTRPVYPAPGQ